MAATLLLTGLFCLGWSGWAWLAMTQYQHEQHEALKRIRAVPPAFSAAPTTVAHGAPIGWLAIPRLHLSAAIAQGDDAAILGAAIGHLPDTPLPWQDGNSALAAHRDTLFRALKDIRVGDDLHLATAFGEFAYRVRDTMIVGPQDLWVLDPTERPTLTLITCYPFQYLGRAPRRFVVRADAVPDRAHAASS
jgi:sortase A